MSQSQPIEQDDEGNGFWDDLEEFFSWFDPDSWLDSISYSVNEGLAILAGPVNDIINFLDPSHEDFFLTQAFMPSEGYIETFVIDVKEIFDNKLSFMSDIQEFLGDLFGAVIDTDPEPPEFKINLPGGKWGQGSVKIIDFSLFAQHRTFILNFFRVILWIPFLLKLYKRLPSLVYQ